MIRRVKVLVAAGVALLMAAAVAGPAAAQSSRQRDKNNMRNLAVGLGAIAAHQAVTGKTTNAIVLGAGAAYAAKKYEDARKAQSRENSYRNGAWGSYRSVRANRSYVSSSNGKGRKVGHYKKAGKSSKKACRG